MFEDEWREMNKRPMNVEYVMSDASLLLPPTGAGSLSQPPSRGFILREFTAL